MPPLGANAVSVQDVRGKVLTPCSVGRARALVQAGKATWVSQEPGVIRLNRVVELPEPERIPETPALSGQRVLLHICCGPCATYVVARLRELGAEVCGYWYNPNIHPYAEHARRRETLARYAEEINLPVIWETGYEMPAFMRAVVGHECFGERCALCYRIRLERTVLAAAEHGFQRFTTTLLISPYQDQERVKQLGEVLGAEHGVAFYFENFRQGFAAHHRLAREHGLYMQRYCGCVYSEWEAQDPQAWTKCRREAQSPQASRQAGAGDLVGSRDG
ncbi:MAG: epoxyqueuosine reductase QueH [Anaerolineae bacterium]|nr:epoxyqueuosine reductase QueH [Anaerolineae bacterium]